MSTPAIDPTRADGWKQAFDYWTERMATAFDRDDFVGWRAARSARHTARDQHHHARASAADSLDVNAHHSGL